MKFRLIFNLKCSFNWWAEPHHKLGDLKVFKLCLIGSTVLLKQFKKNKSYLQAPSKPYVQLPCVRVVALWCICLLNRFIFIQSFNPLKFQSKFHSFEMLQLQTPWNHLLMSKQRSRGNCDKVVFSKFASLSY